MKTICSRAWSTLSSNPVRFILVFLLFVGVGTLVWAHEGAEGNIVDPLVGASQPAPSRTPVLASYSSGSGGSGTSDKALPPLPKAYMLKPADYPKGTDTSEALDEAMSGFTRLGTPVTPRTPECFPAEPRDLFWEMDQVADPQGNLLSLDFDVNGDKQISNVERNAIRGRNTWVLWGGGNEVFWNWLQQEGYGTHDFLILLDSRQRNRRFRDGGLINQPGLRSVQNPGEKILGLYLDLPKSEGSALMRPRYSVDGRPQVEGKDVQGRGLPAPVSRPQAPDNHHGRLEELFRPWTTPEKRAEAWKKEREARNLPPTAPDPWAAYVPKTVSRKLPYDGVDPDVYGYPSGIVGLRLMLNPDFFGDTDAAAAARKYWKARVEDNHDRYYTDPAVHADRRLVRPFRVSMSCGFCHISTHPLLPPENPEEPGWKNLSNAIGNQYWRPQKAFGYLLSRNTFVHHFLGSQQPGTIDTSQVATDQINNSNTINAVFDVPARLDWARHLPPEKQSPGNLRLPNLGLGWPEPRTPSGVDLPPDHRLVPRVLLDGSDSIGAFGALARVYLNIGTYYEQWERTNNIFIGFTKPRPFSVETCQRNSVYWQTNERYRAGYLRDFFTMKQQVPAPPKGQTGQQNETKPPGTPEPPQPDIAANPPTDRPAAPAKPFLHNSTAPMKLRDATITEGSQTRRIGQEFLPKTAKDKEKRIAGRKVWLNNCAICHSSKQPQGFALEFSSDWKNAPVPKDGEPAVYTLPMHFADWDDLLAAPETPPSRVFRGSKAIENYRDRLMKLVRAADQEGNTLDGTDPAEKDHPFWQDNFLSTDIRVPVTLVGTNAGRTLGTNGIEGHMWADFSSDTYKQLKSVGEIAFYDPFSEKSPDFYGNNATFTAPAGGVGYYRPASHISLWTSAPYLHNNTLGLFNNDPSVSGRIAAFEDAMRKMLWQKKRAQHSLPEPEMAGSQNIPYGAIRSGDLRPERSSATRRFPFDAGQPVDPGFIYRLPRETHLQIGPSFVWPLIAGVTSATVAEVLRVWLWVALVLFWVVIAWWAKARHAGFSLLSLAVVLAGLLLLTGLGGVGVNVPLIPVLLMALSNVLELSHKGWWLLVIVLGLGGWWLLSLAPQNGRRAPWGILGALVVTLLLLCAASWVLGSGEAAGHLIGIVLWLRTLGFWGGALLVVALGVILVGIFVRRGGDGVARALHTSLALGALLIGFVAYHFIGGQLVREGELTGVDVGPVPRGMPVNWLMSLNPESPHRIDAVVSMFYGITRIKREHLEGDKAWEAFAEEAGPALIKASKCPDHVLDRGHWFGEKLSDEDKEALIAFLKTL